MREGETCGGLASLPGWRGAVWGRKQYPQFFHVAYLNYTVIVVVFNAIFGRHAISLILQQHSM